MHLKDLEAVAAVYKYKSFSEAANKTNFSISAISKQVSRAEKELGYEIFEKRAKRQMLVLTREGEILMPAILEVIEKYSNLTYLVENMDVNETNALSIGYTPLVGTIGENEIISKFSTDHPEIRINLTTGNNTDLISQLMAGNLDGIFLLMTNASPANFKMWESITKDDLKIITTLRNRVMYLGMSRNHPLANRDSIKLDEVNNEIFIFTLINAGEQYSSRIGDLKHLITGSDPSITPMFMDFSNRDVVLRIVESGKAVLPQIVKPLTGGRKIKYVEVEGWPDEATGLFLYRKTNSSKVIKSFSRYVREYAQKEGLINQ